MKRLTMLPQQENIESIMYHYPERELCNMGGFFSIASGEDITCYQHMLALMPVAHAALCLSVDGPGTMRAATPAEAEIPLYECTEYTEKEICQKLTDWLLAPFEEDKALFSACLFHFANGEWYGCEKFHHLIMDRKSIITLIHWQEQLLPRLKEEGYAEVNRSIQTDYRYLELMQEKDQRYASEEQTRNWLNNTFPHTVEWSGQRTALSAAAGCIELTMPDPLFQQLHAYAKQYNVSAESLWFLALLAERCKSKGIHHTVIGRMTEYRQRRQRDIVGLFSRVLPISFHDTPADTQALCSQLETNFLAALRYGAFSLRTLRKLDPSAQIDFDTLVSYHPENMMTNPISGYHEADVNFTDTPLRIWIHDSKHRHSLQIFYQKQTYGQEQVRQLACRYFLILEQLTSGTRWEDITLLAPADKYAYDLLNHAAPAVSPTLTLPQTFLQWACPTVSRRADQIILKDIEQAWTYRESLAWFYQISDWLRERNIGKGDTVGIHLHRSVWLPVLMLAILHRNAAFLPIHPEEHPQRLRQLAGNCQLIVYDRTLQNEVIAPAENKFTEDHLQEGTPLWNHLCRRAKEDCGRNNPIRALQSQCAYLLYTSGSSGLPKAVQISHYSLMCRLQWMNDTFGNGGITLQKTVSTFDVSVWELLLSPAYGGCLCLMPQGEEKYPDRIADLTDLWKIRRIHFVPGMLEALVRDLEQNGRTLPSLREIFSSGETLKPELAARVCRLFPSIRLINLYGPTECTIDVSFHEYVPGEETIPIGRAVANTRLFVLPPEETIPLPADVPGELCITGDLVGMGYLEGNTGGYFTWKGLPAYRTGDFVSLSPNGELLYLGRRDRQEKLRGMRIDTGAIENLLLSDKDISSAHVEIQNHCLTAYYECDTELAAPSAILIGKFPDYSIPRQWFRLPKFPRKENGKLDLVKLRQESRIKERQPEEILPVNRKKAVSANIPLEKRLLCIIRKYFPANVQADTDLIEEGLDSLTAIQIIQDIRSHGYDCSYSLIFRYPSVTLLAGILTEELRPMQECLTESETASPVLLDYLISRQERQLLLCVPFGGGNSEIFGGLARRLADLPWDIATVSTEKPGRKTIEEAAEDLLASLDRYEQIVLTGYCVGSALATELASRLSTEGKTVLHVFLISSLPASWIHMGKKKFSPWDLLSDRQIIRILNRLYPGQTKAAKKATDPDSGPFHARIPQFRHDTARFFSYMENYKLKDLQISAPVTLFFGGKDPLSIHYDKKSKKWQHFYHSVPSVVSFPDAGHYLLSEELAEVSEIIYKCLKQFSLFV